MGPRMRNVRMAICGIMVVCTMLFGGLAEVSALVVYDSGGEHDIDFEIGTISIRDSSSGNPTIVNLVADGVARSVVLLYDNSIFNIAGGRVDSFIYAYNNGQVNVSDGNIWSSLSACNNTVLTISGGWIEVVELFDDNQTLMTGGSIGETVDVFDDSILTIEGTGFNYPYGTIADPEGILTGTFFNGDPIDIGFYVHDNASIVLVPEPATLLLLGLGGLILRRRKA